MSPDEAASGVPVGAMRGSIHLPRELCETCFPQSESVALLMRDGQMLMVPLAPDSVGGLLLKRRNARGDRVVHAPEFLREHGVADDFSERRLLAHWHAEAGALRIVPV